MLKVEDKLTIEGIITLNGRQLAALNMLYQPLMQGDAYVLYQTLYALSTVPTKINNHLLLKNLTGLSMERMEKCRHILEQYLLLKTYYNGAKNRYIYELFAPLNGDQFLRHEVFGRVYMKQMGKQVYEFAKRSFALPHENKDEYQDISLPFENIIQKGWEEKEEASFLALKPDHSPLDSNTIPVHFNYEAFLSSCSQVLFPEAQRSAENLRLIGELATIHGIDEQTMRMFVGKSINLKTKQLNVDKLKKLVRHAHVDNPDAPSENPYLMAPVRFLQLKQGGIEVTSSDRFLIENLIREYRMQPEVVNVLIEYVLEKTGQKLSKAYVERVAGTWIRLRIDTWEKAKEQIALEQEPQKTKRQYGKKEKQLPDWYEQSNNEDDNSVVDEAELQELMRSLGGE